MMVPDRHRQAEQRLQQAVDVGRGEQVHPARDQRHAVLGIVERDRQMVARRRVLAHQHHVAEGFGRGALRARRLVGPVERPGDFERPRHVEPPRAGAGIAADARFAAGPRIDRRPVGIGRGGGGGNLRPRAPARIDHLAGVEEHFARDEVVMRDARALRRHLVPFEPEPFEVAAEFVRQLGPRARPVDVLDPQQEAPAALVREVVRDDCREGVAEMQRAVRAGGEAGDGHAPPLIRSP